MSTETVDSYIAAQSDFRQQRAKALTLENSWLALAGLYWLEQGENHIGSGEDCAVQLPRGPKRLGVIRLEGESIGIQTQSPVEIGGSQTTQAALQSDMDHKPTRVDLEGLSFIVIRRGELYAVRLWDNHSPARQNFEGLEWFELNPDFRVKARFVEQPRTLEIGLSTPFELYEHNPSPGYVVFELGGKEYSLVAESSDPTKSLFFNFKDPTNGKQTYGAGRFLITEGVKDGSVILDFNRATNPYCAYTHYATCPLPPAENRLAIPILAGEKAYHLE